MLDYIVDMGTLLDEKNIPESGRWLVLPPWGCGMIKKSELKDVLWLVMVPPSCVTAASASSTGSPFTVQQQPGEEAVRE